MEAQRRPIIHQACRYCCIHATSSHSRLRRNHTMMSSRTMPSGIRFVATASAPADLHGQANDAFARWRYVKTGPTHRHQRHGIATASFSIFTCVPSKPPSWRQSAKSRNHRPTGPKGKLRPRLGAATIPAYSKEDHPVVKQVFSLNCPPTSACQRAVLW